MPLIAKNITLTSGETVSKEPAKEPNSNIFQRRKSLAEVKNEPDHGLQNITEPTIVVDGKFKKISKKSASAYLLDMLSLDD